MQKSKHLNASIPSLQEIKIEKARRRFWSFCNLLAPDFYSPDRHHLITLCDTLQAVHEGKTEEPNLLIEMPPRHGKSRTLTNFSAWILGKDPNERIITASFNDDLAQDFSRYTRDTISEERNTQDQIVYADIFPNTRIKKGDSAFHKWALDGQFFSYKGTGIGGSVTGKGGTKLIVDDPVKDAEVAYNPAALEKIWLWYSGTFIQRAEEGAGKIVCMTPWAKGDLASRLLEKQPEKWFVLSMPAWDGQKMLCDSLLSYKSYQEMKSIGDEAIIAANYDMQRLDIKGRLYSGFSTYEEIPEGTDGNIGYTDTADEGKDYLCAIMGKRKGREIYVTSVIYTQDPQEVTEPQLANAIRDSETRQMVIESNNGGRAFARNVDRLLNELGTRCTISWFHQSKNKQARILTNATIVQSYVRFPEDWALRWPAFYNALADYQKEGKNKHDDAPDAVTGLVEKYASGYTMSVGASIGGI